MNELQRMQYLDAMGIDSFVPRLLLSSARPPTLCDLPVSHADQQYSDQKDGSSSALDRETAAGVIAERVIGQFILEDKVDFPEGRLLENASPQEVVPTTIEETALVSQAESDAQEGGGFKVRAEQVRFSLASWRPNAEVLAIDSRRSGDALPTHSLLSNMLQSLGLLNLSLPKAEILNWPMVKGPQDTSWDAAIQMVKGFLEGKILVAPVEYILLLGHESCTAVMGEGFDIPNNMYQCISLPEFECQVVVLPSLTELLYTPALKKDVWHALLAMQKKRDSSLLV